METASAICYGLAYKWQLAEVQAEVELELEKKREAVEAVKEAECSQ